MCLSVSQKYWTALSSALSECVEGYISLTDSLPESLASIMDWFSLLCPFHDLKCFSLCSSWCCAGTERWRSGNILLFLLWTLPSFLLTSSVFILLKRYCAWIQTHFVLVSAFLVHLCVCLLKSLRGGKKEKRSCYSCRGDSSCQMLSKVYLNRIKNIFYVLNHKMNLAGGFNAL